MQATGGFIPFDDVALFLKGKREQHQNALTEQGVVVSMNEDFIHGFASAMAMYELYLGGCDPELIAQQIVNWNNTISTILDNLDDVTP